WVPKIPSGVVTGVSPRPGTLANIPAGTIHVDTRVDGVSEADRIAGNRAVAPRETLLDPQVLGFGDVLHQPQQRCSARTNSRRASWPLTPVSFRTNESAGFRAVRR